MLDEAALRDLMEEMKRDGVPINGFLDRCKINIIGQKITIGVCHGTKFCRRCTLKSCWQSALRPTPG